MIGKRPRAMIASPPRRIGLFFLALALLSWAPARAAGEFDGEWLAKAGCPLSRQPATATVRNYVFVSPLGRGGLPVVSTIRSDNTINLFWEGDRYLSGRFSGDRFEGDAGFGASRCRFTMRRIQAPEPAPVGDYDGAWLKVEIDGCLADYRVDAAIYVSGDEVTGIATGWLTEEFAGKIAADGQFEANATRYRLSGRLPLTENEVEISYQNVAGDCAGTLKMVRRQPAAEPPANSKP